MQIEPQPLISRQTGALNGVLRVPGDKSISHRAVMLGGLASGTTSVTGLLEGEDVRRTMAAMVQLGAKLQQQGALWQIEGVGTAGLQEPAGVLDMGNSGTAARLLIGLLSTQNFTSFFTGDASLNKRPMARVINPLSQIGAVFTARSSGRLPLAVQGAVNPTTMSYRLPVASAQVKSAILLAGLNVAGTTTVIEATPTRDHTENMLRQFGAGLSIAKLEDGAEAITVSGKAQLRGQNITVPADISSASFPMVAALLRPHSSITLPEVGVGARRNGIIISLQEMGANIVLNNQRQLGGEAVADITVASSNLRGIVVPADRAPSMIDEFPVLAMAAACASGLSRFCGLGELRVKESDRLSLVAQGLLACGVKVEIEGDDLIIHGMGAPPKGGAVIATAMDHRIAMSFLVLGMVSAEPVRIDDGGFITTSFPDFIGAMNRLGAKIGLLKAS